jgi:hypothetical protein
VHELEQEVVSEDELALACAELGDRMLPNAKWTEAEVTRRLHASPNPMFQKLGKDWEERKHRTRTLPLLIPTLVKLDAKWRYINYGFQFKLPQDRILCWWPRTGSLDWQGAARPDMGSAVQGDIQQVLEAYVAFCDGTVKSLPPLPKPDHGVLACLVCGDQHEKQTCGTCGVEQADLCVTCFPRAHYCPEAA